MFEILLSTDKAGRRSARKLATLSISLIFHAAVIAAVIVVPLLRADAGLPEFKIMDVLIAPPVLPGVPPGPGRPGRRGEGDPAITKGPKDPPPKGGPTRFMAPVDVPTEITEEDPISLIPEGPAGPGVEGGAGDGTRTWIIGEEMLAEEVKPFEMAITTIRPPRLIKKVNPVYSATAIAAHVSGPVVIAAVTDIYGRVREARVVSGHALLSMTALEAVREWIYEPYLVNGIPKPVSFTVTVIFSLEKR